MLLRVIDFQTLTTHYKNYREGISDINQKKEDFLKKIEPLKSEMNEIIRYAQSGLIVDEQSQRIKSERFQDLQQEAVSLDNDFKFEIKKMSDDLNEKCYDELSKIIEKWSIDNNIDLVIGKMEVVFNKPEFESTNDILEILKEENLFVEYEEKQD